MEGFLKPYDFLLETDDQVDKLLMLLLNTPLLQNSMTMILTSGLSVTRL